MCTYTTDKGKKAEQEFKTDFRWVNREEHGANEQTWNERVTLLQAKQIKTILSKLYLYINPLSHVCCQTTMKSDVKSTTKSADVKHRHTESPQETGNDNACQR